MIRHVKLYIGHICSLNKITVVSFKLLKKNSKPEHELNLMIDPFKKSMFRFKFKIGYLELCKEVELKIHSFQRKKEILQCMSLFISIRTLVSSIHI